MKKKGGRQSEYIIVEATIIEVYDLISSLKD
jgi:hypothetical protein